MILIGIIHAEMKTATYFARSVLLNISLNPVQQILDNAIYSNTNFCKLRKQENLI